MRLDCNGRARMRRYGGGPFVPAREVDWKSARRVCLVGGTGVGKTTLARRLAAEYGLPEPVALDSLRFDAAGQRAPRENLTRAMVELARRESWLAEGIYITWSLPLIESADLVVWLDPPRLTAATRVLRRAISKAAGERSCDPLRGALGLTRQALLPSRLSQVLASPRNLQPSATAIAAVLSSRGKKIARVRTHHGLEDLVALPRLRAESPHGGAVELSASQRGVRATPP
jgi:hypothetical protein